MVQGVFRDGLGEGSGRAQEGPGPGRKMCTWDESGRCSDVGFTHGAWRHAGVRFPLGGARASRPKN